VAPSVDPRTGKPSFTKSYGLTSAKAAELLAVYGRNELPEKVTPKWRIFVAQLIEVRKESQPFPFGERGRKWWNRSLTTKLKVYLR